MDSDEETLEETVEGNGLLAGPGRRAVGGEERRGRPLGQGSQAEAPSCSGGSELWLRRGAPPPPGVASLWGGGGKHGACFPASFGVGSHGVVGEGGQAHGGGPSLWLTGSRLAARAWRSLACRFGGSCDPSSSPVTKPGQK